MDTSSNYTSSSEHEFGLPNISMFEWEIRTLTANWDILKAVFFNDAPPVTRWKVEFYYRKQINSNRWSLGFCLQFDDSFDERREIKTDAVGLEISLNREVLVHEIKNGYLFRPQNLSEYNFTSDVVSGVEAEDNVFIIRLRIHLPPTLRENIFTPRDRLSCLSSLSLDMHRLFIDGIDSNMKLLSDTRDVFEVHSYILIARWKNFIIQKGPDGTPQNEIGTNISTVVLKILLDYLYSGKLNLNSPLPVAYDPYINAELFQVINEYKLYDLYERIAFSAVHQKRVTRANEFRVCQLFPLALSHGGQFELPSPTWEVDRNTPFKFLFTLEVTRLRSSWLSYRLQSRSSVMVSVDVKLTVQRKSLGAGVLSSDLATVYEDFHLVRPFDTVESIEVYNLDSSAHFNREGQPQEFAYYICCYLHFKDRRTIDIIQSREPERIYLDSYNVLADHLFDLIGSASDQDSQIETLSVHLGVENSFTDIHKAIFKARVPQWWRIVKNVVQANDEYVMPRRWTVLLLKSEHVPYVLNYIYSGRLFEMPSQYLDRIGVFARTVGFHSLQTSIRRIRNGPPRDPQSDPFYHGRWSRDRLS